MFPKKGKASYFVIVNLNYELLEGRDIAFVFSAAFTEGPGELSMYWLLLLHLFAYMSICSTRLCKL